MRNAVIDILRTTNNTLDMFMETGGDVTQTLRTRHAARMALRNMGMTDTEIAAI